MISKRLLSILLTVIISAGMTAGCSKSNKNAVGNTTETPKDDPTKKLSITWMGSMQVGATKEGSIPQKFIEDKFNVQIKPVFFDANSYAQKRAIQFASGDIPDIMYLMDPADVKTDSSQGFLMELPYETVKKYTPSVYKMINDKLPNLWTYSHANGKNYGIPNFNIGGNNPKVGVWREDWLKKVGITKIPSTIAEYEAAFEKIVNEDPDGNGKKDTYGMSGDLKTTSWTFIEIFGAYGVLPFNWMKKDGKVVYGGELQETKDVLQLLADWYKKGYIHPDFITDDTVKTIKEKFINGKVAYVNHYSSYGDTNYDPANKNSFVALTKAITPAASVVPGVNPKGPNGKQGTFAWGEGGHIIAFGKQLANQPDKLERLLKILETIQTDETLNEKLHIGTRGVNWDYKDPAKGLDGGYKMLPPYDDTKQLQAEGFRSLNTSAFYAPLPFSYEKSQSYLPKAEREHNAKTYDQKLGMTDLFMKPDVLPSAGKYYKDLVAKQYTIFAQIIRGEKPVSAYDQFIKDWHAQGGDEMLKDAQAMDQTITEILKKVGAK
jgi:putative aldouronate transport system substrate-binding protein